MAAEYVVWENLYKTLGSDEVTELSYSEELENLQQAVEKVKGMFIALEEGIKLENRDGVLSKLGNLVALIHQADDLLDEILTAHRSIKVSQNSESTSSGEHLRLAWQNAVAVASSRMGQEVSHLFSSIKVVSQRRMAGNISKVRHDIEGLVKKLHDKFQFRDIPDRQLDRSQNFKLVKNEVIGREEDKKNLIQKILQPNTLSKPKVSVIPILGSPGIGKSVLARLVFDDEMIKNHFDLRMWIQVSHISDDKEIIREIVESCTNRKSKYGESSQNAKTKHYTADRNGMAFRDLLGCGTVSSSAIAYTNKTETDIMERRLRKEIDGKLYLLVLDDACTKSWPQLKALLGRGARGSHIIVTTRSKDVANLARNEMDEVYKLQGLSSENSWSLFSKVAFQPFGSSDSLNRIGELIVEGCGHVPLTLRVAGSLLYGKSEERWSSLMNTIEHHKNTEAEDPHTEVMHLILNLSYADLPNRLKACFAYCSLFPCDFDFNRHDLISLWIAQGFVEQQVGETLQEAGNKYFLELTRCCFFQDVSTDDLDDIATCKMHPIIQNLSREKAARIMNMYTTGTGPAHVTDSTCKHVSFECNRDSTINIPPSLLQAKSLRSLVPVKEPGCNAKFDKWACKLLISTFKYLRVLDLHDIMIAELSDSIGKLIHLRYLDLSRNACLETLPRTTTKLCNLQTLKLNSCPNLKTLPGDFDKLVNLRRFEVHECDSLASMPAGLEKLTQLEMLSCFVVGINTSVSMRNTGIKALKELKKISGRLEIELTENWTENMHATLKELTDSRRQLELQLTGNQERNILEDLPSLLQNKSRLSELKINWAHPVSDDEKPLHQELLEHLQPHPSLKSLRIEGYKGEDFPKWARVDTLPTSLPNLVILSIEGCNKCQHLPAFGQLPWLKQLTLRHMANVQYVETDLLANSLGDVMTYNVQSVGNEESSSSSSQVRVSFLFFPSLEELTLHNFYNLEGWSEEMILTSRHQTPIRYFPSLSKLRIWNCPKLASIPVCPLVKELDLQNVDQKLLEDCAKKSSEARSAISICKPILSLKIKCCSNLKSFTTVREGLRGLDGLEKLVIAGCDALISLSSAVQGLSSLKRLDISSCKELDLSATGTNHTGDANSSLQISPGPRQIVRLGQQTPWTLPQRHSRRTFLRRNTPWDSLKSLRDLILKDIPKMKTLPEGLQEVTTLKFLWLSACNDLMMLPEWIGKLSTLQHIRIESCPGLRRLPDGIKKVKSLMKVEITECPDLIKCCREHTGEDRHKIEHAQILLHKSWRYGLVSETRSAYNRSKSNVKALGDVKYFIIPAIAAEIQV